jgi:hypothetical protein
MRPGSTPHATQLTLVTLPLADHNNLLMTNLFAQAEALASRVTEGNRPSNTILADALTPHSLGALVEIPRAKAGDLRRTVRAQSVHPGRDLGCYGPAERG